MSVLTVLVDDVQDEVAHHAADGAERHRVGLLVVVQRELQDAGRGDNLVPVPQDGEVGVDGAEVPPVPVLAFPQFLVPVHLVQLVQLQLVLEKVSPVDLQLNCDI